MCLAVTENIIFRKMISGWPQISPLSRKWISPLIFTSIHFRKKRERESARAREEKIQSEIASSSSSPTAPSRSHRSPSTAPSREEKIQSIAIWRHRDPVIAIARRRSRSGAIAISDRDRAVIAILCCDRWWFFFLSCGFVFSDLCFPSSFPNTRKYFSENFLKCNQTHGNIFLFRKLTFPKNMYFPENILQQPNTA